MKKLLHTFMLLLLCSFGFAQTDPISTQLNSVFANIDKSQVPTGFLQEYGIPFLPLDVFTGVLTDSNKVDVRTWPMADATPQTIN